MAMFSALLPLLRSTDVTLHLSLQHDGQIRVTGLPKRTDTRLDASLFHPFTLTGMAPDLDQQFSSLIAGYTATRDDLAQQMAKVQAEMTRKAEASKASKTKSASTGGASKTQASTQKTGGASSSKGTAKPGSTAAQTGPTATKSASGSPAASKRSSASSTAGGARQTKTGKTDDSTGATETRVAKATGGKSAQQADTSKAPTQAASDQRTASSSNSQTAAHYDEAYFKGFGIVELRTIAKQVLPASEQTKLPKSNRKTLAGKLSKAVRERANPDGTLPNDILSILTAWSVMADATS
ncbi:PRTRC system protein E [Rhodovibrio sodomensis]|nr:PRTRC system protein E [Rhodovibrio sodomensis]